MFNTFIREREKKKQRISDKQKNMETNWAKEHAGSQSGPYSYHVLPGKMTKQTRAPNYSFDSREFTGRSSSIV